MAGGAFPQQQVLPEQIVKAPDDPGTNRLKGFQIQSFAGARGRIRGVVQCGYKLLFEAIGFDLAKVDSQFDPGQDLLAADGAAGRYRLSKVRFILNPLQMNVE